MIHLRNMTSREFEIFKKWSIDNYANSLIMSGKAHKWGALISAKKEFKEVFPKGMNSQNNYFYVIQNCDNENVGVICYQKDPYNSDMAFITEFVVKEEFRRCGYGRSALQKVAEDARNKGYLKVGLNVFNYNKVAYVLYQSEGYKVIENYGANAIMEKIL